MKLCSLLLSGFAALASAQPHIPCKNGVYIITARATSAKPGFGKLATLKDLILSEMPNSQAVALPYPADKGEEHYMGSVMEGVKIMSNMIMEYADACPDHGIVLLGNSQGAHVVGDTLAGHEYDKYPQFGSSPGLEQKYIDSIAAVIMMGDPSNAAGQPILFGNSTHDGFHPRKDKGSWKRKGLVAKTRSYCDAGDLFCDGGDSVELHIRYADYYQSDALQFVVKHATAFIDSHHPAAHKSHSIVSASAKTSLEPSRPSRSLMLGSGSMGGVLLVSCLIVIIIYSCRSHIRPVLRKTPAAYLPFIKS